MQIILGLDGAMTSSAFALVLGFVVTTAPAQGLSPSPRDTGARPPTPVATGRATTDTGTGFPAAALPQLNQLLARPDAIEVRKIVLELFDNGLVDPRKEEALETYFMSHSEHLGDLKSEIEDNR